MGFGLFGPICYMNIHGDTYSYSYNECIVHDLNLTLTYLVSKVIIASHEIIYFLLLTLPYSKVNLSHLIPEIKKLFTLTCNHHLFPAVNLSFELFQFEIIMFAYMSVALLLQHLHIYKSVWWLPHSYNAYAMVC